MTERLYVTEREANFQTYRNAFCTKYGQLVTLNSNQTTGMGSSDYDIRVTDRGMAIGGFSEKSHL